MKIFRTATLIVLCLGMALPSAHALALCMDSEGNVALEVAVGGACSGSRARASDSDRVPAEELGRSADTVGCCGSCTDVVIGGGGAAVAPPDLSGKQKLSRPTDEAVDPIDAPGNSLPRISGTRFSLLAPFPERPSTDDSVVLRL